MGILNIGILGAGVVGVTTALQLQKELPSAKVTLIAETFNQETTSAGAAGIFRPSLYFSGPTEEITKKWIKNSYDYYMDLLKEDCGIKMISGYILSNISPENVRNPLLEDVVPVHRKATLDELSSFPTSYKYGTFFHSLLIECGHFLPFGLSKFHDRGGTIESRTVESWSELQGKYDAVVNCTGLGSIKLCRDKKLIPIRGQILKVFAPWLEHFYYGDKDAYIIPQSKGMVTMGGTRNFSNFDLEPSPHDTASIRERCSVLVPKLARAPVLRTWVGLRPHREVVRVEPEIIAGLRVVHNYGHGGYGVTSAPGTAIEAVRHVKELISSTTHKL